MDKVSIVLPVYNSEKTIGNTIHSIVSQTYKNIELIIVNDGSTDKTHSICKKYYDNNKKIIKYICKKNTGVSNSRNIGLLNATGRYIMFIDSDDTYYVNMIEEMVKYAKKNNYQLLVCGYERVNENTSKSITKCIKNVEKNKNEGYQEYIEKLQKNNMFNQLWNKIYLKEIIDNKQIKFNEELSLAEDLEFNLKYIECINKAGVLSKVLYKYINNTTGLNLKYRNNRLESNLVAFNVQKNIYFKNSFEMNYLNERYIKICLSGLKNIELCSDNTEKKKKLEEFKNNSQIHNTLEYICKNSKRISRIIIARVIMIKNYLILSIIAKLLCYVDKIYKKNKLGY